MEKTVVRLNMHGPFSLGDMNIIWWDNLGLGFWACLFQWITMDHVVEWYDLCAFYQKSAGIWNYPAW